MQFSIDRYDERLLEIDHWRRYPEMLPFVGTEYDAASHQKLLLIAESHYLPSSSHAHDSPAKWYQGSSADLKTKERGWINTRAIVNLGKNQKWPSKGQTIFCRIERELLRAGLPRRENVFAHVGFLNCFLRPAGTGQSLARTLTCLDVQKSVAAVRHVLEVLGPDRVCFLSTLAWNTVGHTVNRAGVVCEHTAHPACPWWYRASTRGNKTAREVFLAFVQGAL